MTYKNLKVRLDAGEIIVLDGGTGTELQRRGAQMDPSAWCGPASLNNSELLTQVHLDYIDAGADVVTANTFASSRLMLTPAGYADRVEEINRIAVEAALRARDLATKKSPSRRIAVAGSLSLHKVCHLRHLDLSRHVHIRFLIGLFPKRLKFRIFFFIAPTRKFLLAPNALLVGDIVIFGRVRLISCAT